jgi:hypothetical protein
MSQIPPVETSSNKSAEGAQQSLDSEITRFVHNIDALHACLPLLATIASAVEIACQQELNEFAKKFGELDEGKKTYKISADHSYQADKFISRYRKASANAAILPQSYIVALVSQYDSFLGGILRCFYRERPELLNASERPFTYAELLEFGNVDAIKEHLIEKEVEALLRDSHSEQFKQMATRFDVPLNKDLPIWSVFIELTERRNLFVHCDGVVTAQYLAVCDRHRVDHAQRPKIGDRLGVTTAYFQMAHACVFEIGTKLAHVLWRKLLPQQRDLADNNLIALIFDLLVAARYDLVIVLGTFALDFMPQKFFNESHRRVIVINLAQAYKWNNDNAAAMKRINKEDWSACSRVFQLAVAVLKDDFEDATKKMKAIGKEGEVKERDYRNWPLFNEFRKTPMFLDTFQDIFGHAFEAIAPSHAESIFAPHLWKERHHKDAEPAPDN